MICRVCLEDSYSVLKIFDDSGKLYDIAYVLGKYLWFKPRPDDPISTAVCCDCWQSLHEFHQFYIKVEQAHSNLESADANVEVSDVNLVGKTSGAEQFEVELNIKEELLENTFLEDDFSYPNEEQPIQGVVKDELNPLEDLETQTLDSERDYSPQPNEFDVESNNLITGKPVLRKRKPKRQSSSSPSSSSTTSQSPSPKSPDRPIKCSKRYNKKRKVNEQNEDKPSKRRMCIENITPNELDLIKKHIPMQCELCFFITDNYIVFTDHFKTEHKGMKAYVKCCSRRLSRPFMFVMHAQKHENPENNKCKICNKSFSEPDVLRTHTLKFHAPKEQLKFGCDKCPKRFLNKYYLKLHEPLHIPQDEWQFVCDQCPQPKRFPSDHLLQNHRNICHEKPVSVCYICGKEFRYGPSFDKHVRSHFAVAGPRLKCTIPGCDTWLKDEENLKIHIKRHGENGQVHICTKCNKEFKNRNALWGHMRYNHSNISFDCTFCDKVFRKPRNLKEHMAAQHTGKFLYQCNFCDKSFRANSNLCTHRKKKHPIEYDNWKKTKFCGGTKNDNNPIETCKICNKNYSDADALRIHLLRYHTPKEQLKYACSQCPKRFVNKYRLKLHEPLHIPQDEWQFVCDLCPQTKRFPSDHSLQNHKISCHEKPGRVCHICGKEFRYNTLLDRHVRSHLPVGSPRLKCTLPGCDIWLKDEENLKKHIKRHGQNDKIHTCTTCLKEFKNRNALLGHIRYSHSDITYNCTFCNKIFKKPRNLQEHMAAQHTGKFLYQCDFCDKSFRANSNWCTHRKKVHPVEYANWKKTKQSIL